MKKRLLAILSIIACLSFGISGSFNSINALAAPADSADDAASDDDADASDDADEDDDYYVGDEEDSDSEDSGDMMEMYKQQYKEQMGSILDKFVGAWVTGSQRKVDAALIQLEVRGADTEYEYSEEDYQAMFSEAGEAEKFGEIKGEISDDMMDGHFTKCVSFTNKDMTFTLDIKADMTGGIRMAFGVYDGAQEPAVADAGSDSASQNDEADGDFLKAGLNTVMGMGTVFAVLIFISFIISLFSIIGNIPNKEKRPKTTFTVVEVSPEEYFAGKASDNNLDEKNEIAAVIAAAISAYEEDEESAYDAPDGLFVRSIKKRGFC